MKKLFATAAVAFVFAYPVAGLAAGLSVNGASTTPAGELCEQH